LVAALIAASGRAPADWMAAYPRAYLRPQVHCLLAHDLAFMPRGETVILVLEEHTPVRVFMKASGEEVAVMHDRELTEEIARIPVPL
jgi:siderophore synthetase component